MVRLGKWKLTYQPLTDGAIYRLFDIEQDPGCRSNVFDQYPEIAAELRALLDRWMSEDPRVVPAAKAQDSLVSRAPAAGAPTNVEAALGKAS
jgi:hypothetical protein